MGDTSVDFFLETLKELITSSKLDSIIQEKHQLQALEEEIKYLRGFLKVAEKKRNEHSEVMKLVMEIRDVVSEAENIVEWFVIHAFEPDPLDLESVKKEIKTLTVKLEHINDGSVPPINSSSAPNSRLSIDCWCEIEIERGMGDPSVHFCLETLKELITSSNLDSIRRDNYNHLLQSLEKEIKCLEGLLKLAKKKRNGLREWETRPVLSKAKNVLKRFVKNLRGLLEVGKRKRNRLMRECETRLALSEAKNILERFVIEIDALEADHLSLDLESVKKEIRSTLTAKVKQIYDENIYDIYGTAVKKHSFARSGGGSSSTGNCNTSKVVKEKVVVGFDKEVERLIERLDYRGEGREIVTIIGPGGSGKTTLAREVYDHSFTLYTFEIRAWVDVSQDYDKTTMKRDLLIRVLKSAFPENQEDYEKSTDDMLGEKLLRYLKGRKYLIVMDDVWGIEAWNDIQRSFPNECNGSKVLFTSRQLVQLDSVCIIPHNLDPLTKRHSWELLQKKVFGMKYCCPPELVDIGVKIVEKCEGLPLAIVAIAGILSTEDKTLDVWEEVFKNLSSIFVENKEAGCMEILELSYNHLPLHLKACFLYIGAFLEDSEIRVRELLWLWIAEGFIKQSEEGKSLEAVARDHLINLIDRSLVIAARKSSLGGIKACRIHDLLRLFCLKKAKEDNFFVQIHRDDSFSPSATNKARRLFIAHQFFDMSSGHPRNFHSFLCLPSPNSRYSSFKRMRMSFFARNFGRLRVFSFISAEFEVHILGGHLVHLRYLATRVSSECDSRDLSVSISNLLNLETLDLKVEKPSDSIQLPCDIFKMGKLRHLYSKNGVFMYHVSSEEAARVGFDDHSSKLDNLQTLHHICACKDCQNFLVRTPNLRKLGLAKNIDLRDDGFMVLDLEFLNCLETLSLSLFIPMARMTFPLIVEPRMKLPLTVKRLTLRSTSLKWEELSIFQNLPSLEVLKLGYGACIGPVWNTSGEGFPQLKYLRLSHMYEIEEWIADEDQFPRLENLVLEDCSKLERIPIDFAKLNELREIKVTGCTRSLEESAKKIQEEQRNKNGDDDCPNLIVKHNFWDSSDESE